MRREPGLEHQRLQQRLTPGDPLQIGGHLVQGWRGRRIVKANDLSKFPFSSFWPCLPHRGTRAPDRAPVQLRVTSGVEITINTPALLFPDISLLMISYTTRFLQLAILARSLHTLQPA